MMKNPKPPLELLELQTLLSEIITRPFSKVGKYNIPEYDSALASLLDQYIAKGPFLSAAQKIGIYNQQYWWRLYHIMQNHYPGLLRLFGSDAFNEQIAKPYLAQYPPSSWSLHNLGERLPLWIESEYNQSDKALVLAIGKIDAAHQKIWHAPTQKRRCKISEKEALFLKPSVILQKMPADLIQFRNRLLEQEKEYWTRHPFPEITREKKTYYFVLFPENLKILWEEISETEYQILKAFEKGSSIGQALDPLPKVSAKKIGKWFETWAQRGWL